MRCLARCLDCVLTPTYPRPVTLAELRDEPVKRNSDLGYYTNFMNLLDYAAVAVPVGFMSNGLPSGVTLFGRAFTDQYLLSVADALQRVNPLSLPGGTTIEADAPTHAAVNDRVNVVVCGAHLDGLALNYQLRQRQGHLVEATLSAPAYRLYALADGKRPGMVRVSEGGRAIAVEVWALPSSELGSFLAGIPAPLGLGKVELEEGQWLTGFICENNGLEGATDITEYGGWRAWLASRDNVKQP
jgi:allophanate hydrolase